MEEVRPEVTALGKRVRLLRDELGLTQGELAERAGLSVDAVSRVESSRGPAPNLTSIFKIADTLGVTISALFEEEPRRRAVRAPSMRLASMLDTQPDPVVEAVEACARAIVKVVATQTRR